MEKFEYKLTFVVIATDEHDAMNQVYERLKEGGEADSIEQIQSV